jgi:tripartite-type tricarboxylate transporter receptor subunit TctC
LKRRLRRHRLRAPAWLERAADDFASGRTVLANAAAARTSTWRSRRYSIVFATGTPGLRAEGAVFLGLVRRTMQSLFRSDFANHSPRVMACLAFAASALMAPIAAQSAAEFYRGKQITLMVGSNPGGGYDAVARLVARHLGRFVPGNPIIIVQNTPGGGSIAMSNRIYRVEPQDGTVLGLVQRGVLLAQLTGQPNVQFDVTKFNWIGSVSPELSLVVASAAAPVKSVHDLLTTPLIVGGTGVTSDLESSARLLNAMIGAKFKIVSGYAGQADVLLAMERDEVQGSADWSWSEIKTRHANDLRDGKISLILQNTLTKASDLPDVPVAMDFIKDAVDRKAAALYFGVKQVARPVLAGPGVPADRLEVLRSAFAALKDDEEYRADADRIGLSDPTPARVVEDLVRLAASASPDVVRRLTEILNPRKQ